MRTASLLRMAALTLVLAACQDAPSPLAPEAPEAEQVIAAAAPAGLGTCRPRPLQESVRGRITPATCLFSEALGRRSAYFAAAPAAEGSMLTVTAQGDIALVVGVKEATEDPTLGTVWGSRVAQAGVATSFSFIGSRPAYQLFVSNRDSGETGGYVLEARSEPITHACSRLIFLDAPTRFRQELDEARSCSVTIRFSPYPEAIGKPLLAQYHYAKLLAGQTYEVRAEGLSPAFPAGLTVFRSTFNGYVMDSQSVGPVPAGGVRSLTITPAVTTYYALEVSSGMPDGNGGWLNPAGSYTLSLSQN